MSSTTGVVTLLALFGNTHPITNSLTGGIGVAVTVPTVIPEPSTLLSFGTGLIGLAGMMGRRLKLRT
jgi:hypothetical protein